MTLTTRSLLLLFHLFALTFSAHSIGQSLGPSLGSCTGITCSAAITFSPSAGTYVGPQSITIATPISGDSLFYTSDNSPVTEASLLFSSPFTLSNSLSLNAMAVLTPLSAGQSLQSAWTGWKTQLSCTSDLCSPYTGSYSSPAVSYCGTTVTGTLTAAMTAAQTTAPLSVSVTSGTLLLINSEYMQATSTGTNPTVTRGTNGSTAATHTLGTSFKNYPNVASCGVSGVPTAIGFDLGVANPSISGNSAHMWFTTQNIPGAGNGQTQVLWGQHGVAVDNATFQAEDFYALPAENFSTAWALEEDLVLWVQARHLILSAALECVLGSNKWQFSGQTGGWRDFGFDRAGNPILVYKNGVAIGPAGTRISEGCSRTNGGTVVGALNATSPTFTTSLATLPNQIIHVDNENILIVAASGTNVTASIRGYYSTASTHLAAAPYLTWLHVQYHATFNPSVVSSGCLDAVSGLPTECIYIDYLTINSNKYTFGTTTTTDSGGHTITVSNLKVPAAPLPTVGYPSSCRVQIQLDTQGTGASTSTPKTYGMYYDNMGLSCGTGKPDATATAPYTIN